MAQGEPRRTAAAAATHGEAHDAHGHKASAGAPWPTAYRGRTAVHAVPVVGAVEMHRQRIVRAQEAMGLRVATTQEPPDAIDHFAARAVGALEPLPTPLPTAAGDAANATSAAAAEAAPVRVAPHRPPHAHAPLEAQPRAVAGGAVGNPTAAYAYAQQSLAATRTLPPPPPLGFGSQSPGRGAHVGKDDDPFCAGGLPDADVSGLPIKTGTGYPMGAAAPLQRELHPAWPESGDVASLAPPKEPLLPPPPNVVNEMLTHDAERMSRPGEVRNRVIYDSVDPNPEHAATDADADADADARGDPPRAFYVPEGEDDSTLVFESRFESGNLRRAIQVYAHEYDLILRPDINTRGHTQWFYFSIANTRRGQTYKLNIINLVKRESLFQHGMRVLVHSRTSATDRGVGWRRAGSRICYYQNNIRRRNGAYYYTLTFTIEAEHDNDLMHIAYCYPYTYTDLQRYLHRLESCPIRGKRVRRRTLCQTLAGNSCDLLTVTTFHAAAGDADVSGPGHRSDASGASAAGMSRHWLEDPPSTVHGSPGALPARKKRGVFLSGRVHPGESNASWVVKGVLDFLTGPGLDARLLRDSFCFKVVPMLNPDGVVNGNYRCSLAGADLNRTWNDPSRRLHPTVFHAKQAVRRLLEERGVALFCDFHGHSRKRDVFVYGCERKGCNNASAENRSGTASLGMVSGPYYGAAAVDLNSGGSASLGASVAIPSQARERVFPRVLADGCPDRFRFASCKFKVQSSKESTARVVCYQELGIQNSYTLEATFAGASSGGLAGMHLDAHDLLEVGRAFCVALLDYCDPSEAALSAIARDVDCLYPQRVPSSVPALVDPAAPNPDDDSDEGSGGSDSDDGSGDDDDSKASKAAIKAGRRGGVTASARGGRRSSGNAPTAADDAGSARETGSARTRSSAAASLGDRRASAGPDRRLNTVRRGSIGNGSVPSRITPIPFSSSGKLGSSSDLRRAAAAPSRAMRHATYARPHREAEEE